MRARRKSAGRFARYDGDYRTGALTRQGPVTLIPSAQDPKYYIDENMV